MNEHGLSVELSEKGTCQGEKQDAAGEGKM
jgi:hypothetical protein